MSDIQRTVIRGLISGLEFVGERIEDAVMALDDLLFEIESSGDEALGVRGPTPNMVIHDELNGEFSWPSPQGRQSVEQFEKWYLAMNGLRPR